MDEKIIENNIKVNKPINCITTGIQEVISQNNEIGEAVAKWCVEAGKRISKNYPDFIVGRPGAEKESFEDDGRTLILSLSETCPKCYAVFNETGGITFMLAEEY